MKSAEIVDRANRYMVGGVSAGGRHHPSLGKSLMLTAADGCILTDIDGHEWVDYHNAAGASLLGF